MARLADCLKKAGLSQHEAAILKGKVDDLRSEDYGAHEAAVEAVKAHLADLKSQFDGVVKQVASERDWDAAAALHDNVKGRLSVPAATMPVMKRLGTKLNPLLAQRARSVEPLPEELDVIAARVSDILDSGASMARFDGLGPFHTYTSPTMHARYSPGMQSIGVEVNNLRGLADFAATGKTESIYATVMTSDVAHESWHHADNDVMGRGFFSTKSPLFEIKTDTSTVDKNFVFSRRAVGPIMAEAFDVFQNTTNDALRGYLRYPLLHWDVMETWYGDRRFDDLFKEELFAQLGALYDTNRQLLQRELPQAYTLFDRIAHATRNSQTIDDVRREVRRALQPSADAVAAKPVERGTAADDGGGVEVGAARRGMVGKAGDGRVERPARGINVEVAPNPDDDILTARFDRVAEQDKRETTYAVAQRYIPRVLNAMGLKGLAEHTIGGFVGHTNPSIIVRFGPKVSFAEMVEAGKVLGYVFNQKAVIAYDEAVTTGEGLTGFVKVEAAQALSYEQQQKIFAQVYAAFPEAGGFTGHNGVMVFGNYTDLTDADFHSKLDAALPDTVTTSYHRFRSDWIEPATLEGTRYGSQAQTGETGGAGVRGPGYIDSLRAEAGRSLDAHVRSAEAARQETALVKELSRLNRHLTSEEKDLLFDKRRNKLVATLDEIPAAPREFMHAALAGRANKGWYRRSREAVEAIYGQDSPRFLALMAALSPQTSVRENFYNTARVWAAWLDAGRTTDTRRLRRIFDENLLTPKGLEDDKSAMIAWSNNGMKVLTTIAPETVKLSGPKVDSFRRNLFGDLYEVTNDRHMANFAGIVRELLEGLTTKAFPLLHKGPGYLAMSVRTRQAAEMLTQRTGETWEPAEVQETVWSFWKALDDLAQVKGETRSALQLLRSGALTHEMIANVPDLGSFFHEEQYRAITGTAPQGRGVNPEEAARFDTAQPRAAGETGPVAATPVLERIARRVDEKIAESAREKAAKAAAKAEGLLGGEGVVSEAPPFSLAPTSGPGVTVERAQTVVDAVLTRLANAAPVTIVPDVASLPFPAEPLARGAFYNGNVYLVASNLHSAADVQFTLLHEMAGHYGLRGILGESITSLMERVYDSNDIVRDLADARMARTQGLTKALAAEEALADLAGTGRVQALPQWKMILASIRNALRGLGFDLKMSDNDIVALLANARRYVEQGKAKSWGTVAPALSEKAPTFYSALAANIGKAPFNKAGEIQPAQLKSWIESRTKDGMFKKDEVEWSGLNELLQMKEGKLTRDEVNTFLDQHRVRVGETMLGEPGTLPDGYRLAPWPDPDNPWQLLDPDGDQIGIGETEADAVEDARGGSPELRRLMRHAGATEFSNWQLEGGKNYRELLITLKPKGLQQGFVIRVPRTGEPHGYWEGTVFASREDAQAAIDEHAKRPGVDPASLYASTEIVPGEGERAAVLEKLYRVHDRTGATEAENIADREHAYRILARDAPGGYVEEYTVSRTREPDNTFTAGHFDEPNVLVHVRFNERTDPSGKRVLFVEEIQSDWAQKGRKEGFAGTQPEPPKLTALPTGWKLYQATEGVKASHERLKAEHQRVVRAGREAGVFGSAEKLIETFGAEGRDRLLRLWATVANEWGSVRVHKPIEGMDPQAALEEYAATIRPYVPDAFADVAVKSRKVWKVKDADGTVVVSTTNEAAALARGIERANNDQHNAWISRRSSNILPAPFVQKTEAWVALAMKRIIRYAAENGFDRVAWTTGEQQAQRYSMSAQVSSMLWTPLRIAGEPGKAVRLALHGGGTIVFNARADGMVEHVNDQRFRSTVEKPLTEVIGKDLAAKVMAEDRGDLHGLDLDIGGEGHKAFYNRMVPNIANDLLKKFGGGRVGDVVIQSPYEAPEMPENFDLARFREGGLLGWRLRIDRVPTGPVWRSQGQAQSFLEMTRAQMQAVAVGPAPPETRLTQPGFEITDKLRESAMSGLPLFSMATDGVLGSISQEVLDRLSWGANKFSWIHKSVSTQFHKAQINRWYRPVYQAVQRYLQDTNAFAADVADTIGEDVLPQLKSVGAAFKRITKETRKDIESVGRAVFTGTLGDYRPSEADLRLGFASMVKDEDGNSIGEIRSNPLNERQIEMYQRVRSGLDLSLAQTVASEMVRLTKDDGIDPARAEAKDNPERAAQILLVALNERKLWAMEAARDAEGPVLEQLEKSAAAADASMTKVQGLYRDFVNLKARGYAPLMRFGQYTIDVQENTDGELKRTGFYMFESKNAANKMLRLLQAENPDKVVTPGTMSPDAWQAMQGLSLDSLEAFARVTGMDTGQFGEAVQEYLRLAISSRSAMKRLIARHGYAGFSEDLPRVLASFVTSQARLASRNYHMADASNAAAAIPEAEGETKGEAAKLVRYIADPMEEAHTVRGLLFVNFIGGSIASALTNITQPVMMTLPYLTQYGPTGALNVGRAANMAKDALFHALKVMRTPGAASPALREALVRAAREGITEPQEIHQLHAEAIRGFGSNLAWRRGLRVWGAAFSLAESFNRQLTFTAAFEMAEQMGMDAINTHQEEIARQRGREPVTFANPFEFAENAVTDTQGIYNKGNRPNWARGPIGATVFTFKQFSIAYVEFLARLPGREKLLALALLTLAAGADGLPFADDLLDLLDTIGQTLGYATNSKKAVREWAVRHVGEAGGAFLTSGVSGLPGSPVDLSGRFGMGNLVPGTAFFARSTADAGYEVASALGPMGSVLMGAHRAYQAAQGGEWGAAGRAVAPRAIGDAMQALNMAQTGYYIDQKGRKVIDTTGLDALVKSIGILPGRVGQANRLANDVRQDIALHTVTETSIADRWARGILDNDPEAVRKAIETLFAWNLRNPEQRISIQPAQIRRRVQEAMLERRTRLIKQAPKEIRGQVSSALGG